MFECPNCGSETNKLVGCDDEKKIKCPNCHQIRKRDMCNLHEIVACTPDGTGRVTRGKAWEIDHRVIAEDGMTVVNRVTGQEAQY